MVVNTRSKTALNNEAGAQHTTEKREPIKESLLFFKLDNVISGLSTKQTWDPVKEEYGSPEPQFYFKVGSEYPDIPKSSEGLIALGTYLIEVGQVTEGVTFGKIGKHSPEEIQNAKAKLDRFRKVS
jgi:hypothetical protein